MKSGGGNLSGALELVEASSPRSLRPQTAKTPLLATSEGVLPHTGGEYRLAQNLISGRNVPDDPVLKGQVNTLHPPGSVKEDADSIE